MHMSGGSMCIPQEQGLVNGSESLCNKLQEQSLVAVGMLTRKIMHLPMTRLAFMIVWWDHNGLWIPFVMYPHTHRTTLVYLVIYLSTYQLPKLVYLLSYLSTTYNSLQYTES
jgi:hypothetical protein